MVSKQLLPFDLNNITPYAIGFDRIFDQMAQYANHQVTSTGFPPYNIQKDGDYTYKIECYRTMTYLANSEEGHNLDIN